MATFDWVSHFCIPTPVSGTIRFFCFYAAVDDECSIPAINAASQIMTVNSHIVLPRICMKYQNMLTELTSSHGTIQS